MSQSVKVSRFFTIPVHELFGYFIDPVLIEKWSYPEGMSLKVTRFDAEVGGRYRYEHHSQQGTFICEGHFRSIERNELIRMVDDRIYNDKGELIGENLACDVKFTPFGNGSGVEIIQSGFKNPESAQDCEKSWNQCFNNLQELVKDSGIRQFNAGNFDQGLVQT